MEGNTTVLNGLVTDLGVFCVIQFNPPFYDLSYFSDEGTNDQRHEVTCPTSLN